MQPNPSPQWTHRAEAFGAMLKAARLARGITQKQLAEAVDIPQVTRLSAIENGKCKPGRHQLDRLCAALDIDRDEAHAVLGLIPLDVETAWLNSEDIRLQLRDIVDAEFLPLV